MKKNININIKINKNIKKKGKGILSNVVNSAFYLGGKILDPFNKNSFGENHSL